MMGMISNTAQDFDEDHEHKASEPPRKKPHIVPCGTEDDIDGVALCSFEVISLK